MYVAGFVIPVPADKMEAYRTWAKTSAAFFQEYGCLEIVESWEDKVPTGKVTDFRRAVQANDDEAVVFSWIEWPDKETRDTAMGKMEDLMKSDPRFNPETNPMPFDGKRMIFGGFAPVVTLEK